MNRKYSDKDYREWEEAYRSGLSTQGVADLFGVKKATVKNALGKMGVLRSLSEAGKGRTPWNKGLKGAQEPWNKGMSGNYPYPSPMKGVPSPYKGVPKSQEFRDKVSETWRQKVEDGYDKWNVGWKTPIPGREAETDTLYLVVVADTSGGLHYKIGRSFRGPKKRLKGSLVKVIATWQSEHWRVWWAERVLLEKYSENRSKPIPEIASTGGTECFRDLNPSEVMALASLLLS